MERIMKKQQIIFAFFAALVALSAVSCQKDQDVVTLHAVISEVNNDSKVYINAPTPYWHNGDQIRINDADYTLQKISMANSATIPNVTISTSGYRAIFPAGILTNSDDNINSSSTVFVTLPTKQVFEMVGAHQRVDVPMGAYISSGITLRFHNLCTVVRVHVSNTTNAPLPITSIILTAEHANLSGVGAATITGDSTDAIAIYSVTGSHSVNLCRTDNTPMKTVEPLATEYFDLIVPEFSIPNDVTIIVATPTGSKTITIEDATVAHNTITNITVNVDELTQTSAELVDGWTFTCAIPPNATAVRFEYNNPITSSTTLSTATSPYPIYGYMDGTTWVVSTIADRINANADCGRLFYGNSGITSIDFGDNFNTANVLYMATMFRDCNNLTSLDLSSFNTSNVTDMFAMFYGCNNLTSLNLSSFNTANVTDMSAMFASCSSLTSLDLSNFNTSQVIDMRSMFSFCGSLTSLNLSSFNTSNVSDMSSMFWDCYNLTSLDLSSFNTENVVSMRYMFDSCCSLTSLDLSNFNTANVKTMCSMFNQCSGITRFDLSNFNTANVVDMYDMFRGCSSLTSLNLSSFNTANVKSMDGMFSGCSNLTGLNLSSFNTSNVEYMWAMFFNCSSLMSLDLSNFNTSNVKGMGGMFYNCSRLTSLNLYNFDMSSVYGKDRMCYNLASESGACTITCPTAVQTQLQSGTDLNNSIITWHTH